MAGMSYYQLDYVFFVAGISFFILAIICFLFYRQNLHKLPWAWLCGFGILAGIKEWMSVIAILGDGPVFALIRLGFVLVASLCLLEFGRRSAIIFGKRRVPGSWVLLPLIALSLSGSFLGIEGLNFTIRYGVGLFGGIWAGWAIWGFQKQYIGSCWNLLSLAAVSMVGYSLVAGPLISRGLFFPNIILQYEASLTGFDFFLHSLRALTAVVIAIAFWQCWRFLKKRGKKKSFPLARTRAWISRSRKNHC